ncbi:hypothetical protein BN1723_020624, partial [Verticillium longisporum]
EEPPLGRPEEAQGGRKGQAAVRSPGEKGWQEDEGRCELFQRPQGGGRPQAPFEQEGCQRQRHER